jgi:hypothetical protein
MKTIAHALFAAALIAAAGAAGALELRGGEDARWVSGGIGEDERIDMLMLLPDYNLRVLTAAEKSGAYLAGVEVVVRDAGGRVVFETELAGPFLLARLAPGKYALQASYGGKAQTRTFAISESGRRDLFFYWTVPDVETLPKGEPR